MEILLIIFYNNKSTKQTVSLVSESQNLVVVPIKLYNNYFNKTFSNLTRSIFIFYRVN